MTQMIGSITLLLLLEVAFVALCVLWGPADCRRSRFWTRVTLTGLGIAGSIGPLMVAAQIGPLAGVSPRSS